MFALLKAIPIGIVLAFVVALFIGSGGSSGGMLNVRLVAIEGQRPVERARHRVEREQPQALVLVGGRRVVQVLDRPRSAGVRLEDQRLR